ncbi:MAG: TlpA disulfide reductase family protein [Planctomycetota bacterium]|nr:TlpA disulfide reductase family protein [Planctomycetota bacterium]
MSTRSFAAGHLQVQRRAGAHWQLAITIAGAVCAASASIAAASAPGDPPASSKQGAPASKVRAPKDAQKAAAILEKARRSLSKVSAISYSGVVTIIADGAPRELVSGQVVLSKADAGGWKAAAVGKAVPSKPGEPEAFKLGHDGATARSLREQEQVLLERTIRKSGDLHAFFATQGARGLVAWELFDDKAFDPKGALSYEGESKVGGELVDAVAVLPADRDAGVATYYVARGSGQIVRVDRESPAGSAATETLSLVMSEINLNELAQPGQFVLTAPDGYTVRSADERKPKRERRPAPEQSDNGLLPVGSQAPDFELKDPGGNTFTLASFKDKVVLLDFWGSWCPPCRAAMPGMQRLHERFKNKPVAVVGLNFERSRDADPQAFMRQNKYTYKLLLNAETIAPKFQVSGWPTFYVLDQNGKVLWSAAGHSPAHEKEIAEVIERALASDGT